MEAEITKTINELEAAKKKLADLLHAWAEKNCPYKVGDTVTIYGYTHRLKKGVVTRIAGVADFKGSPDWKLYGDVFRKDGTLSNFRFDFCGADEKRVKEYENKEK